MALKFCWHKWEPKLRPEGWLLHEFSYRKCAKCGRWEAKGPKHYAANFWQQIEVPAPGAKEHAAFMDNMREMGERIALIGKGER